MRPDVVVVVTPERQYSAGISQGIEYLLIEAFICYPAGDFIAERAAQAAVERLDVAVLLRLARVDVVPLDLIVVCPLQDGLTDELGAPPQENDPPDRFPIFVDQKLYRQA